MKLPEGVIFDGEVYWAKCPECGNEQGDMGTNICCEECGYGPMPTTDNVNKEDEVFEKEFENNVCPDCGAELIAKWSGVKCSKCDYWFCF